MSRALFIVACLFLLAGAVDAAQWARTYSRPGFNHVTAQPTADGGYIAAGKTASTRAFMFDAWLLKLDAGGNVIWQKTYGGPGTQGFSAVHPTADGSYVAAGDTTSFGAGSYDLWLLKVDANGNVIWQKTYGGPGYDVAGGFVPTPDGGYLMVGNARSFAAGDGPYPWVLKLDASGDIIWQKTYLCVRSLEVACIYAYTNSVHLTPDGGFVMSGYMTRTPNPIEGILGLDAWVMRLDPVGNLVWAKKYGGVGDDTADSVRPTADGGYIVGATTKSFDPVLLDRSEAWVLKLDAAGDVVWQQTYGGTQKDNGGVVAPTADGGYLLTAGTRSFGADGLDAWVLKLDSIGNVIWQKTYGGTADDALDSFVPTVDGGYIASGTTLSFGAADYEAWLMKVDGDFNSCINSGTSNAIVIARNAPTGLLAMAVVTTTATPGSSAASVADSAASQVQLCRSASTTDVPTLSYWGTILMCGLLVLCAAVIMRRRQGVGAHEP